IARGIIIHPPSTHISQIDSSGAGSTGVFIISVSVLTPVSVAIAFVAAAAAWIVSLIAAGI
ncbi:MAG: hypothetical protein K2J94_04010, partial [Duncaniella sp.]|nr:hypothetical protein [Duncaniella sp.]